MNKWSVRTRNRIQSSFLIYMSHPQRRTTKMSTTSSMKFIWIILKGSVQTSQWTDGISITKTAVNGKKNLSIVMTTRKIGFLVVIQLVLFRRHRAIKEFRLYSLATRKRKNRHLPLKTPRQCFSKVFAREPLLLPKNNHESSQPRSRTYSMYESQASNI